MKDIYVKVRIPNDGQAKRVFEDIACQPGVYSVQELVDVGYGHYTSGGMEYTAERVRNARRNRGQ